MKDDAAQIYRKLFPGAFVGMVYGDLILHQCKNLDLWEQVLQDELYRCRTEKKRPYPVTWLVKNYQEREREIREIKTPRDRLTTHHNEPLPPVSQNPVDLGSIFAEMDLVRETHLKKVETT